MLLVLCRNKASPVQRFRFCLSLCCTLQHSPGAMLSPVTLVTCCYFPNSVVRSKLSMACGMGSLVCNCRIRCKMQSKKAEKTRMGLKARKQEQNRMRQARFRLRQRASETSVSSEQTPSALLKTPPAYKARIYQRLRRFSKSVEKMIPSTPTGVSASAFARGVVKRFGSHPSAEHFSHAKTKILR